MGLASFAAVPFYNWFCRVTGYGGTTVIATKSSNKILEDYDIKIPGLIFKEKKNAPKPQK